VTLAFTDHRRDPGAWARALGVSREAIDVYLCSDVIDQHVDSFIWTRLFGYRLDHRHGRGLFGGRFYSQVDLPRVREARIAGCVWSITTNPFRPVGNRASTLAANVARLRAIFESCPADVAVCRDGADYRAARAADRHAAFVGIQGGNALDASDALDTFARGLILRVTLVHLSTSSLGATSAPGRKGDGHLTAHGRDLVHALDAHRVFVDLAHIDRRGFWDAVETHDRSLPLVVSHTGVSGVTPHWRNIDDDQLRAIADTGGVIGVMYQANFLGDPLLGGRADSILDHLDHIIRVVGDDHAALGSDWDGMVIPPRDLPTCLELPRLADKMLARGWSTDRIRKVLGGNFLRALDALRPPGWQS